MSLGQLESVECTLCFLMRTLTYTNNFPNINSGLQTPLGLHLCLICLCVSEMLHVCYRYAVTVLNETGCFFFFSHIYIGFLFMSVLISFEVLITSYFTKVGSVSYMWQHLLYILAVNKILAHSDSQLLRHY